MIKPVSVMLLFCAALGVSAHDGDTFRTSDCIKRRLWGVDAVELDQTCDNEGCGIYAREALRNIIEGGELVCDDRGASYDRVVSRCTVNGVDVGRQMVRLGWAIDVPRYSGGEYADEESEARSAGRGTHAYKHVVSPEQWRRSHGKRYGKQ
jgi:endonuclease YncB( thermonuclease family)